MRPSSRRISVYTVLPILKWLVSTASQLDTVSVFQYIRAMKNITITLREDIALWLRVQAAKNERSVSKWVAELLEGMKNREDEYEVAMERFLSREPRKLKWVDGRKPSREELHERSSFR